MSSGSGTAEHFGSELRDAVCRHCVDGNLTCDLSGGADSRALALIAGEALGRVGRRLSVLTYTGLAGLSSADAALATAFASQRAEFDHRVVCSDAGFFGSMDRVPRTEVPFTMAYAIGRTIDVLRAASSSGPVTHLSGDGGDSILQNPAARLADLYRARRWRDFAQQTRVLARRHALPSVAVAARAVRVARRSHGEFLRTTARALARAQHSDDLLAMAGIDRAVPPIAPVWLTQRARELLAAELVPRGDHDDGELPGRAADFSLAAVQAAGLRAYRQVAAQFGVDLQFPYFDHKVIGAAFATDVSLRPIASDAKPLLFGIHRSTRLPQAEWVRPKSGLEYAPDFEDGLRRNLDAVIALFRSSRLAEAGLIDHGRLVQQLSRAALGAPVPPAAIARTVAAEIWLQRGHFEVEAAG